MDQVVRNAEGFRALSVAWPFFTTGSTNDDRSRHSTTAALQAEGSPAILKGARPRGRSLHACIAHLASKRLETKFMDLPVCPACGQSVLDDDASECPFCGASMSGKPGAAKPAGGTSAAAPPSKSAPAAASGKASAGTKPAAAGKHVARSAAPGQPGRADREEIAAAGIRGEAPKTAATVQPRKSPNATLPVKCPMCETSGFVPLRAAGQPVRCANPDCLVPVFTAPAPPPKPVRPAPVAVPSKAGKRMAVIATVSVLGSLAVGAAAWWLFVPRLDLRTIVRPVIVDLPSLMDRSIDEIRDVLPLYEDEQREPTRVQLEVIGLEHWDNVFVIRRDDDEQNLLVTFDPRTRRVIDFFLEGDDKNILMQRANLSETDPAYRVVPVKARNAPGITGIKIVPVREAAATAAARTTAEDAAAGGAATA
ncbi:MAG: hypothetical protein WD069_16150, partial [Planctomycetales bacterium]